MLSDQLSDYEGEDGYTTDTLTCAAHAPPGTRPSIGHASHRKGHWFEPSIAHVETLMGLQLRQQRDAVASSRLRSGPH